MSTARWRHRTDTVSMESVRVYHGVVEGMEVHLGDEVLWVESEAHFDDLVAKAKLGFANLGARRQIPLPRTDNILPSANVSGACMEYEE